MVPRQTVSHKITKKQIEPSRFDGLETLQIQWFERPESTERRKYKCLSAPQLSNRMSPISMRSLLAIKHKRNHHAQSTRPHHRIFAIMHFCWKTMILCNFDVSSQLYIKPMKYQQFWRIPCGHIDEQLLRSTNVCCYYIWKSSNP